jgi:DNA modification methylase
MPLDDLIQFQNSQSIHLHIGDCMGILQTLPKFHFQTCVTSPPYFGLRDYQVDGQIGMEQTPDAYVARLVDVFREVRRVLRDDGTVWLNLGDSYAATHHGKQGTSHSDAFHSTGQAYIDNVTGKRREKTVPSGYKPKDLMMIPSRVAIGLQSDGWFLRSEIIWHKTSQMPEAVRDRPTSAHEKVYLLSKRPHYYYDADSLAEPSAVIDRPQMRRALELAERGGLTSAHLAALRACGITDVGKSQITQDGFGHNTSEVMKLAAEAKQVLGGYTREFLNNVTRNGRNVWTIAPKPFHGAHFATMPPELARRCILAGCPEGELVLDPFGGAGTTGLVAGELNRRATLIELNPVYANIARERLGHLATPADDLVAFAT